jgi:hypothetical protein
MRWTKRDAESWAFANRHPRRFLRSLRLLIVMAVVGILLMELIIAPRSVSAVDFSSLSQTQKRILSGFASLELNPDDPGNSSPTEPVSYSPRGQAACAENLASNIKVNQNCLNVTDKDLQGRGQAHNETAIAQDPLQPDHIVATSNDYRRGDGNCFNSYSRDGGRTWNDAVVPMGFTRGQAFGGVPRQYWEAGGDPAVAWDTQGNAYLQCMVFDRGAGVTNNPDSSSAVYVFRSTQNFGASWDFPGRPVVEAFVGAAGLPLLDKPYMTVDNHIGSPFQDRIYVTWTLFSPDGTAIIMESHSADFGDHFSPPVTVSGSSTLCPASVVGTNHCDANQFSQPFTAPDGSLYVVFDNYNNSTTGSDNRNQVLMAKSTDGGSTFGPLVKVADFYDLPDCVTYQGKDAGRACVPEKGSSKNSFFRAANYPSGAVNPVNPSQIVVAFASYINVDSKETNGCVPAGVSSTTGNNLYTGVKTAGACNNKILLSVSSDSGGTFTGTTMDPRDLPTVNQDLGQQLTDQWWQWIAFTRAGRLAISYYDRQYRDDETTGFSDVSLSGSGDLMRFAVSRVTSESMPPPTQFSGTFFGDYTGLTAVDAAHPLWMDTRNADLFRCPGSPPALCTGSASNAAVANTQDIFTAAVAVPSP